jgi:hypothetical protein
MKQWTEEELINDGNRLRNAEITNVSLNFKDHGVLTLTRLESVKDVVNHCIR